MKVPLSPNLSSIVIIGEDQTVIFGEIDCIIERSIDDLLPVEIKSGKTISNDYFKGINYWQKISGNTSKGYVIYGGESKQTRENSIVLPWQQCLDLFD